jgi:hypothetical protein
MIKNKITALFFLFFLFSFHICAVWQNVSAGGPNNQVVALTINSNTLFATSSGSANEVYKGTNLTNVSGPNWQVIISDGYAANTDWIVVDPNNSQHLWLSATTYGSNTMILYNNLFTGPYPLIGSPVTGWGTASPTYDAKRLAIDRTNSLTIVAAGNNGEFVSKDGGNTWQKLYPNIGINSIKQSPVNSNIFYFCGITGMYTYNTLTGIFSDDPSNPNLMDMDFDCTNPSAYYSITSNGYISYYDGITLKILVWFPFTWAMLQAYIAFVVVCVVQGQC